MNLLAADVSPLHRCTANNLTPPPESRVFFVLQRRANLYSRHMRTVSVQLGNRSYAIKIAPGLLDQLGRDARA